MGGIITNRYSGSTSESSGGALTVRELDGSPSVSSVSVIQVSNGTLFDNGGGVVTITTGGGGGGTLTVSDGVTSVGAVTNLTFTSGATVTSGGVGIANVSISGGTISGTISTTQVPYGTALDTVGGDSDFTYDDTTDTLSVPNIDFGSGSTHQLTSTTVAGATGASFTLDTFDGTVYRSVKYFVQITNTTTNEYQASELLAIHNGSNLYITAFANVYTGANLLGSFSASYAAGTGTLTFVPSAPLNTFNVKIAKIMTGL